MREKSHFEPATNTDQIQKYLSSAKSLDLMLRTNKTVCPVGPREKFSRFYEWSGHHDMFITSVSVTFDANTNVWFV
jgi:hypothetical protein